MIKGPFVEVEALLQAGRIKEATAALKRSSAAGAPTSEVYLWLGRIEETRGRPARAEQAYLRAVSLDPKTAGHQMEFGRFLEARGRFEDAAARFINVLALAGPSVAAETALGRARGKNGAVAEAEGAFRRAMALEPSSPEPRAELFRLLNADGRAQEARALAAQSAVTAIAGPVPGLFRLAGIADFRKEFLLEAARTRRRFDRFETAVRGALVGETPVPGARILLVETLLSRRRFSAAMTELAAAFRSARREDEESRVEVLIQLVDKGRYAPDLERALLDCVGRAGGGDKISSEWPQVFSALMCARRYREAFRLAEAVLDRFGRFESPGQLMWPWWHRIRRAVAEEGFILEELERIRAAARCREFPHWFAYYRAILLSDCPKHHGGAMSEYRRLRGLDARRYSWMLQSFVLVKLDVLDLKGAIRISRDILRRSPSHWWVRCRMAEAYMASGGVARGLREFEKAERSCGPGLRSEVLTWHGEALLWLGEYARALTKFDEAVALGAKTFVFGWRGAARFKSGDAAGALADLDRAVELDPKDFEARVWRSEVYRSMGRGAEALQDAGFVIANGPRIYWSHVNRALLRDALGDEDGMTEDFMWMPKKMRAALMKTLGFPRDHAPTRVQMREILTAGLELARGVRRWEDYVQPIWMERLP